MRHLALASALALSASTAAVQMPAWADSTVAYCVLSQAHGKTAQQKGPCHWSQRQGNVTLTFQSQTYDFPSDQDGKTYSRLNREGAEAGPVFTRKDHYTLSVYWRKPAAESTGF